MRIITCWLFLVCAISLGANWDWAYTIGGAGMERTWDISCDAQSNTFVAGEFSDTLWVNGIAYQGYGLADSYIIKYNPSGQVQWAKTFGSSGEDIALGVANDANGNCYVAGYFVDTFTCQGQSVTSFGMWDTYVLKLDAEGNLLWLRSFGSPLNDIGYGLAVNASGRVYVAGWFADTIKFTGGDSIVSAGGSDVFCCAWDTEGSFLWAERAGSAGVEYGYEVACDNAGNAYVTGVAGDGSQFGNFFLPSNGMFVCKYNPEGTAQWLASSSGAGVIAISVEPDVNAGQYGLVCGRLTGSGAIGSYPFSSIDGGDDAYWAAFDANTGIWIDMQYYGGSGADKGKDCDCGAYPLFLASFEAQAIFGGLPFNSTGEADLILGYGDFSTIQWTATGGPNSEVPTCIKLLPNGKIAVAGWHFGLSLFGNLAIDTGSIANQNAFVACFNPQTTVEDPYLPLPSALQLSPNPFSESLKISFERAAPGINSIDIYNLKGQKVSSIKLNNYGASLQSYYWDGCDLSGNRCSAGIYLLRAGNTFQKALKLQ